MSEILVTGGAGYIGTHVLCALAQAGKRSISIDNYSNSSPKAIARVLRIAPGSVEAFKLDIGDQEGLKQLLEGRDIECVIHLAGLKSVGESAEFPERYHDNNVIGTARLLEVLAGSRVRKFVFSSSATVYGAAESPISESAPAAPQSPYGHNKLAIEKMLAELAKRDPTWRVASLRYFNPVGAHGSGLIGEDPAGTPNNLMPFLCQVAAGLQKELRIYGGDYPTPDGTGVRDYIHVVDLAEGHLAALHALEGAPDGTVLTVNLGTGRGYSVLDLVQTFERVNHLDVPRVMAARRPGDTAVCFADTALARKILGWKATRGLEEMCLDSWKWQRANPNGYR